MEMSTVAPDPGVPCSSLKASIYFLKLWVPVERYEVYIPDTQTTYTGWAVCLLSTQLRAEEFLMQGVFKERGVFFLLFFAFLKYRFSIKRR